MAGVNKVILVGNLGADPEVTTIDSGIKRARIRVATTETYKNRNGDRTEHTEWHNITIWRGLAEVAEKYLRKGSKIYVEGRLRTREYNDKDGVKKYFTEVAADNFVMLDRADNNSSNYGNQDSNSAQQNETAKSQEPVQEENPEDDLPF
jgi:single-strand DNA-binding protein